MSIIFIIFFSFLFIFLPGLVFLLHLLTWETPSLKLLYNTLWRDLRAGYRYFKLLYFVRKCYSNNYSVCKCFQIQAKKTPSKPCLIIHDEVWTFQQVEEYSNKIANAFAAAGYKKGDEVSLFMENKPEFICIWLGLAKIGVVCGLINTNLREQSLAHSMNVINSKAVIFNVELAQALKEVIPLLDKKSDIDYLYCGSLESPNLFSDVKNIQSTDDFLKFASSKPPNDTKDLSNFTDVLFYIYTSGTTGLPKAAIIRHSRFLWMCAAAKFVVKIKENDIIYNCLPLYHSSGGILFTSVTLIFGNTMAIRKKFSATHFWNDCIKYKATVSIYIGEICRYLLNQPEKVEDRSHSLRLVLGVGLRPQLWTEFQKRFRIPTIVEVYGSTEGNTNLINMFGKVGSVGFISRVFSKLYPVTLVKVNPDTSEPIRNEKGLCVRCQPGEAGVIVGKIIHNNPVNSFDGYSNKSDTNKKIINNCFQKGDIAFHSGDVLTMDEDGYLYFMDRTGDTFRWRGENISTTEVEMIISKFLNLTVCVVYGVEVPGCEGKAGMVAIQSTTELDLTELYKKMSASLPTYAVPLFIRICKEIESTGTYKLRKVDLQKEGFDPNKISDPLFMLDAKNRCYVKLTKELNNKILNGEMRL